MEKRQLGNTDMHVSVLGFGGSEIGYGGIRQDIVRELLDDALDAGLNVIDTAECYVTSEELIGQAVAGRRDDFYLFTKCGHPNGSSQPAEWDRLSLVGSIERSLRRLRTDRLDLVQLHSCSEDELRRGEVIEALQEARDKGYTRYSGYSGDGGAARYAIECGAFDALQTSVNIADQEAIELTLPLAKTRGIGVIAKRPVANAAWRTGERPADSYHHTYWERLRKLDYDFLRGSLSETVGTALRWTLAQEAVATAIVGTTKPGRWRENAGAVRAGSLPTELMNTIHTRWREVADASWVGQT